jgi:hypothetical protein
LLNHDPSEYSDDLYTTVRVRDVLLDGVMTGSVKYALERIDDFPFLGDLFSLDLNKHPGYTGSKGFAIYRGRHNAAQHE